MNLYANPVPQTNSGAQSNDSLPELPKQASEAAADRWFNPQRGMWYNPRTFRYQAWNPFATEGGVA